MTPRPLRFRPMSDGAFLAVNDAGRFFATDEAFVDRVSTEALHQADEAFLVSEGHTNAPAGGLAQMAHLRALAARIEAPGPLDYLILVPTLRCNLGCSYCQVSRAPAGASGFDWSDETLEAVLGVIDRLTTDSVKIEFQGGEPTLRPDLIRAVIERCERFETRAFVICTNLSRLSDEVLDIVGRPDVFVSTSLDGDAATHRRNRTADDAEQTSFERNLALLLGRFGPAKVSALPTVDPKRPPEPDDLIDAFASRGLTAIYLRPINYQGFARKRHADSLRLGAEWRDWYERFVERLIERNWSDREAPVLEETYLSLCFRRIFRPGADRHVDLRNPNAAGVDYIVVDHDGTVYPSDEARMLARSGVVDLAIGDVRTGWATERRDAINRHATNMFDPACMRCAYQPFCGRDVVDDLARYGTIDVPRADTEFCRRHLHVFDLAFRLIYSADPAIRHSVSRWLRLPGAAPALGPVHA